MMKEDVIRLNEQLKGKKAEEVLDYFLEKYQGHIALASSLGIEDQVLTAMICGIDATTRIFTLDTGRLFPETYSLIGRTNMTYGIRIQVFFPDYHEVEKMVAEHGVNLFYDSIEYRRLCCHIRKLEPLKRAFQGMKVWIAARTIGYPYRKSVGRVGRDERIDKSESFDQLDRNRGMGVYP